MHNILRKKKLHPYAYTIVQDILPEDYVLRTQFCEFMLVKIQENPLFLSQIIWTDESKFSIPICNEVPFHFSEFGLCHTS